MDMTTAPLLNEPASQTTARFLACLKRYDLDYGITWQWAGRVRHGVLEVFHNHLGPCDGNVLAQAFERNTALWEDSDCRIGTVHTGSPKHLAVRAALQQLSEYAQ